MMDLIADLEEEELLNLAIELYNLGYRDGTAGRFVPMDMLARKLKLRIEEWLEI